MKHIAVILITVILSQAHAQELEKIVEITLSSKKNLIQLEEGLVHAQPNDAIIANPTKGSIIITIPEANKHKGAQIFLKRWKEKEGINPTVQIYNLDTKIFHSLQPKEGLIIESDGKKWIKIEGTHIKNKKRTPE